MSDWISFYDFKHSVIYVNARHRDVHYRTIAQDIRGYVPSLAASALDYGCGEATSADLLAAACEHHTMVEAAPNVRAALKARHAGNPKISVLTPDEADVQPSVARSVVERGRLVLARLDDVPEVGQVDDRELETLRAVDGEHLDGQMV